LGTITGFTLPGVRNLLAETSSAVLAVC